MTKIRITAAKIYFILLFFFNQINEICKIYVWWNSKYCSNEDDVCLILRLIDVSVVIAKTFEFSTLMRSWDNRAYGLQFFRLSFKRK